MSTTHEPKLIFDRRGFIVAAGAAAAVVYFPGSLAAPAVGAPEVTQALADWSIDDMWGVYPRPSEAIGFGRPRGDGETLAAVHPADALFVV